MPDLILLNDIVRVGYPYARYSNTERKAGLATPQTLMQYFSRKLLRTMMMVVTVRKEGRGRGGEKWLKVEGKGGREEGGEGGGGRRGEEQEEGVTLKSRTWHISNSAWSMLVLLRACCLLCGGMVDAKKLLRPRKKESACSNKAS
jgi:hypothetical protein